MFCRPGHKGHDDLTSSSPSSGLSPAVFSSHAPPVSAFPKARLSFKRIRGMSSPGKDIYCTKCFDILFKGLEHDLDYALQFLYGGT
ncbi:hypothetical protein RJT34_23099 [Clitoria ternatea]|uniref:Uncharacterized protein n=1 Tax=Clitoria ternatea TaxID=43366 RepID=A0AAN9FKZ8_CLITE